MESSPSWDLEFVICNLRILLLAGSFFTYNLTLVIKLTLAHMSTMSYMGFTGGTIGA